MAGFHVNVQYEHYFGENINRGDFALIPVNTAQAYLGEGTFHSALSVSVTQDFKRASFGQRRQVQHDDAGVANATDRRRRHRHLHEPSVALPSTGVAYTASRGGAADRVVISAPYLIGGL